MNQRLVESVAQIVLSMSDDERRLLGRKLRFAGLQQIDEPTEAEKSLRVAEIAQDIQDFEKVYPAPLSALPTEQWTLPAATAAAAEQAHPAERHHTVPATDAMPTAQELANMGADVSDRHRSTTAAPPESFQSFVPMPPAAGNENGNNGQENSYELYQFP